MRFLFLTQYFPPEIGGPQTRLHSMTAELVRLGHQVEVVTSLPNYPRGRFFPGYTGKLYIKEMRGDVCVHRVWLHPAMGGGIGRILNYLTFTLTCLYGVVRCNKPDYLFVESPPLTLSIPAFIASRFWNIPYIFNVADLWPDAIIDNGFLKSGLASRILSALEHWSYRRASYVNAVTDGIRNVLLSVKKVAPEKVLYLPNGADTRRYRPTPPDLDLIRRLGLEGKQVLLWAGTMGYAHGLDYVLQAAKLLSVDSAIHFVFVGDGSARAQLENLARALNLHNVTFCDPVPVEQLPPYFSIALCGLASLRDLPTHDGARPSKIFPVLASGKPIIFVGKGECARLITEARAGLVVPPENPQAFAAAISTFCADSGALRQCGANGRQFVEDHYDWSKLISEWLTQLAAPKISGTEARASHAIANPKA